MPRVTVQTLAELIKELQPHLGQTQFPHVLYQALRRHVDRRAAVVAGELRFPDEPPQRPPTFEEAGVSVWWAAGQPEALTELVRTVIRAHATISDLRTELLSLEAQSSRSARMIGILAHEIKNPLFAILGSLELLQNEQLDENARKLIQAAHTSAQRMHKLVNDSLKLLSIEEEGVRLKAERCSANELLQEIAREAEPVAAASQVHLRLVPIPGDAKLLADRRWLQQAVLNIVLNAIKYTPAGGRVLLRGYKTADSVGILVEDTGPGIPAEQLERIFEPFQRGDTKKEGSGLGLTIVKRVVEAHGGEVSVESQPGRGSTFAIRLPRLVAGRSASGWALRVLVLTALLGLVVTRLPIYPVQLSARTAAGVQPLSGRTALAGGGVVRLGDATFNFDPGSELEMSARKSLWGGDLRSSLRVYKGGVGVERGGPKPALNVALNYARLEPRGTEFYASTGGTDLVSLYQGALALAAPGFSGDLAPGEGAAVSAAGVQKRKLPAAPQVRSSVKEGVLTLRWLPVEGAASYQIEMLAGGVIVGKWQTRETSWSYAPRADRRVEVRVAAVDDLGLVGPPSQPQPYLEEGSFYRGHQLYREGRFAEAARELERAVGFDATNAQAWLELGLSQLESGQLSAGEESLKRALELEPDYEEKVVLPLARALEKAGRLDEAARYYDRAKRISVRDATLGEVRVQLGLGRPQQAEKQACAWLREHPDDGEMAALLRRALDAQGKPYAEPGCPVFQEPPKPKPKPKPAPKPAPPPEPAPQPEPAPPEPVCNPFCN
ncbi:ATP-binding protein [Oceanithermus sp.]